MAAIATGRLNSGRAQELSAALGSNGLLAEDGGFLLPSEAAGELIGSLYEEAVLAPLCDRRETSRRFEKHHLPAISEKSRAEGSRWGGVRTYWLMDGDTPTATRPRFDLLSLQSKRLVSLCYASAELASDAPALEGHLRRAYRSEASFSIDEAIVSGGAGRPLGLLAAGATIDVAKETGQAAATILAENISKMWKRLPLPSRRRAVWLTAEDGESAIVDGGLSAKMYQPAGTHGNPYPTLFGRPLIAIEQAPALGSRGDLILGDMSQYILEDAGESAALSVHVRFVNDELLFRFIYFVDGQPGWASPITPANGSAVTRSPFVALAARQ